jgi:enterochelin esterase-like enzyme
MKPLLLAAMLIFINLIAGAQPVAKPTVGSVERLENFPTHHVQARHVDVWLPEGYSASKRYKVLYMQDGQMLFDANTTWNKQAWHADVAASKLMKQGRIHDTLIVGIWSNSNLRHSEYYPEKFLPYVAQPTRNVFIDKALEGQPRADAYLRFIVEELKPMIDATYATHSEADSTFLMGSSMGGMISIYAMNEYPQVFGGAAGLSTHWMGSFEPNAALPLAAFNYLRDKLANPLGHRLYMDHGTIELDAAYAPYQTFIDQIVKDKGYTSSNFMSRVFEGTGHNEHAWADRLETPLLFLLGKQP